MVAAAGRDPIMAEASKLRRGGHAGHRTRSKSSLRKALWHLAEMLRVIRLSRGPLLASTGAAVMFYLPDQIRELYRITASDQDRRLEIPLGIGALFATLDIWWVSFEIVQRFGDRTDGERGTRTMALDKPACGNRSFPAVRLRRWTLASRGLSKQDAPDITSPWQGKAEELQEALGGLQNAAIALTCFVVISFSRSVLAATKAQDPSKLKGAVADSSARLGWASRSPSFSAYDRGSAFPSRRPKP